MAQIYADENFPLPAVEALRTLGHDVLTSHQAGHAGNAVADEAVLAFTTRERRALVTLNRKHFIRLHLGSPNHSGIVVCTFDSDFAGLAQRIDNALRVQPEPRGVLIRINRPAI